MSLNKLISPFLKPKWKHRNPEIRRRAIAELTDNDTLVFHQIASTDNDPTLRAIAIDKISDLEILKKIIDHDFDHKVRDTALLKYKQILSGLNEKKLDINTRLTLLTSEDNQIVIEYIAKHGQEPELRIAAINQVNRQGYLGDLALTEPNIDNRISCLEKISQKSTLERVVKEARKKDKRLYRIAKDKLDLILDAEEKPKRLLENCNTICEELEHLLQRQHLLQEKTTYQKLKDQWQETHAYATDELSIRYDTITTQINQALNDAQNEAQKKQQYQQLRKQKELLCHAIEKILSDMQNQEAEEETSSHDLNQTMINTSLQIAQQSWAEMSSALPNDDEEKYQHRFNKTITAIHNFQKATSEQQVLLNQMQDLCEYALSLSEHKKVIKTTDIIELNQRWQQLDAAVDKEYADAYRDRFKQAIHTLEIKIEAQKGQHQQLIISLNSDLEAIQNSLNQGGLQDAKKQFKRAQNKFDTIQSISNKNTNQINKQIHTLQSKLNELSSWQNWASVNERENLCLQAEALINSPIEPEDLSFQIKELQNSWKALKGTSPENLWERFNNACNEAYEPCKGYFAEQSKERKNNLAKKNKICDQLRYYINKMDWTVRNESIIDWKIVEQTIQQAKKEWHDAGIIDRKHHKKLEHEFNKLMDVLYEKIKDEWERNKKIKLKLIQQIETIAQQTEEDINKNIDETKKLQSQWQQIGSAGQRNNQKLWKQFNQHADTVFKKRKQIYAEKEQIKQLHIDQLNKIIHDLDELVNNSDMTSTEAEKSFGILKNRWDENDTIQNSETKKIANHFKKSCQNFIKQNQSKKIKQQIDAIHSHFSKVLLCSEVENAIQKMPDAFDINTIQDQWNTISSGKTKIDEQLEQRFNFALESFNNNHPIELGDDQNKRQTKLENLCLHLEIIAEIDSPSEYQEQRMQMQVERLAKAIHADIVNDDQINNIQKLDDFINQWVQVSSIEITAMTQLNHRFKKAFAICFDNIQSATTK